MTKRRIILVGALMAVVLSAQIAHAANASLPSGGGPEPLEFGVYPFLPSTMVYELFEELNSLSPRLYTAAFLLLLWVISVKIRHYARRWLPPLRNAEALARMNKITTIILIGLGIIVIGVILWRIFFLYDIERRAWILIPPAETLSARW